MSLEQVLKKKFGYEKFRNDQEPIIRAIMSKRNVLAILPTGTGKSICYQLPALLLDGITIVVSPLLSLMEDQVQELRTSGIKEVVAINSFMRKEDQRRVINNLQRYKLVYVSPEMLQHRHLKSRMLQVQVSLFVVDEAHCISQWGHDFRPDYLRLGDVIQHLGSPPCLAITATATKEVQRDLIAQLSLHNPKRFIQSINRPEIVLSVENCVSTEEKIEKTKKLIHQLEGPGMIYFSSRLWAESMCEQLKKEGHQRAAYYHGGLSTEDRILIQQQFMNEELDVICCTSAFGMGINKKNIRYVLHFHFPIELEAYVQEIGRAARDYAPSIAISFFCEDDRALAKSLIERDTVTMEQLSLLLHRISHYRKINEVPVEDLLVETGCSDTTWRLTVFQLEQLNVINNMIISPFPIDEMTKIMLKSQQKRMAVKLAKWKKTEEYLTSTSCRRNVLLHYFSEEKVRENGYACCDICSFSLSAYNRKKEREHSQEDSTWQEHLKAVFKV
ncbi:RecQ family ATP-dependent DNA helicase [Alkalihalobacillus hemicellulosilyticus]|uniref:ATP-dependent DNA helicase RecQ n=1 Tax=Halalkalibacter hemicellulosilyticusJCM 9152 TaxID=1236971 RepID=W4QAE9_9BACI|nr:ATP-dependent DNA helicase RecQ [Halalkalibacter hemicellulosilyticus]GAE28980.1 ATP-dependent DNA helicase [Halalkalibacter hemicellulosilyticusJCM 9152]